MTDNRATERLMAMLEERGVKHELEHDIYVEWVDARGNDVTAFETSCKHKGDVLIVHVFLTPEQAIAATLGKPKVKKVRGLTYDEHGGEVYYLACSGCGDWVDGDLDCIGEADGPNFCHNCGGEFDGPLMCKVCGELADMEFGDMCAECYWYEGEGNDER